MIHYVLYLVPPSPPPSLLCVPSIFTLVVMLRSRPALGEAVTCTIVDSLNYSTFTFGQPPQFIGLEANQVHRYEIL